MNAMIGQKISITADKPQTTRHIIRGIITSDQEQIIYVDTPGIHQQKSTGLNKILNRSASAVLRDVDLVLLVVRAGQWTPEDQLALDRVEQSQRRYIIVVNQVDRFTNKEKLLPYLACLPSSAHLSAVIAVSATRGEQLLALEKLIKSSLPEAEFVFAADEVTDASERFLAAEIVREKLSRQVDAELPYSVTVEVEHFVLDGNMYRINTIIWVERDSQKAIVIGKGGERLKLVGIQARQSMQHLFGRKVHLELWVKVKENWVDDIKALRSLGYD